MKRLFPVCAIAGLLMAVGSMAWAATNLNSSRSNIYRLTHDPAVTAVQAAAVLQELDKLGPGANEATVRMLLQKQGVNLSLIKLIRIIPPGTTDKLQTILILTNPADEGPARHIAVSDSGVANPRPIVVPKGGGK